MIMSVLDTKMWRDLNRLKTQALAVSLVIACGVATLVLALGAYRSLDQTRAAFYDRYQFPTVFASANRVPASIQTQLSEIPGVSRALLRIRKPVLLDMPALEQPASGVVVSVPNDRNVGLARLYLRSGRLPFSSAVDEVAVLESFAVAHGLSHGDTVIALINGRKRHLRVVGIVISPEYIYAMGPGDMVPDPERFGVLYLHERALGSLFDMRGVFNDIALTTYRQADIRRIIDALDVLLESYGGTGAHGRSEQMSHAFLDSELVGLRAMSAVIPPIFLLISAFLVNMIMTRLIALEREHIGLLKAMGFGNLSVATHYVKLVAVIAIGGFVIGALAGTWLGQALTELYGEFFSFPFLLFDRSADLYVLSLCRGHRALSDRRCGARHLEDSASAPGGGDESARADSLSGIVLAVQPACSVLLPTRHHGGTSLAAVAGAYAHDDHGYCAVRIASGDSAFHDRFCRLHD